MLFAYDMRFRILSFTVSVSNGFRTICAPVPDHSFQFRNPESASTFRAGATKVSHFRAASDNFACLIE